MIQYCTDIAEDENQDPEARLQAGLLIHLINNLGSTRGLKIKSLALDVALRETVEGGLPMSNLMFNALRN